MALANLRNLTRYPTNALGFFRLCRAFRDSCRLGPSCNFSRATRKEPASYDELTPREAQSLNQELQRLRNLSPQVVIIWPEKLTVSQYRIWEPYLLKCGYRVAVYAGHIRDNIDFAKIAIFTSDSVEISDLHALPDLKGVLYPTHKASAKQIKRKLPGRSHIYLNHGESDKISNASKNREIYDYLFVADEVAVSRYQNHEFQLPNHKFFTIGATVYEGLNFERNKEAALSNILYAPTWEGHQNLNSDRNYSSVANVHSYFSREDKSLISKFEYRFLPHPSLGVFVDEYVPLKRDLENLMSFSKGDSKIDLFNWSDVIFTDISGVMAEYLFTGKPIVTIVDPENDTTWNAFKSSELPIYTYAWNPKTSSIAEIMQIVNEDSMKAIRAQVRKRKFRNAESLAESQALFNRALRRAIRFGSQKYPFGAKKLARKYLKKFLKR